jgi:UMF1 family MFS transporter
MLLAFLIYNDGIGTIYRTATLYGAELGLEAKSLILALVVVQFVGIPATFAFGAIAGRIGTRPAILAGLAVYVGVSIYGYFLDSTTDFFVLAVFVGFVQGGTQALSRSLFSQMIPAGREAEYFSAYEIADKGTSWLGALIFGLALQFTGSYRIAIISLLILFGLGTVLLARTNVRTAITEAGNPQPPKV